MICESELIFCITDSEIQKYTTDLQNLKDYQTHKFERFMVAPI